MRFIFVYLPIIILVVGWLLGRCRITRALACLAIIMAVSEVSLVVSILTHDPTWLLFGLLLMLLGIVLSVAFSFATSTQMTPAPIEHMVDASARMTKVYQGLSPETKQKVNAFARGGTKILLQGFAKHLKGKGYNAGADALRHTAKLI